MSTIAALTSQSMDRRYSEPEVIVRYYDPKIHRKLHQNDNPFVLHKYDGRIKKCCGCKMTFKSTTGVPKYVIAHEERYVYGRVKGTKHLLTRARNFYYHCDLDCIRPRHPYFDMCDVTAHPATVRGLTKSDSKHLQSMGVFARLVFCY